METYISVWKIQIWRHIVIAECYCFVSHHKHHISQRVTKHALTNEIQRYQCATISDIIFIIDVCAFWIFLEDFNMKLFVYVQLQSKG